MTTVTAIDVANWMCKELDKDGYLEQEYAVNEIEDLFGSEFVYFNDNDNLAIGKNVLKEFRKLTDKKVIWSRSEKMWEKLDENELYEGRQVD